MYSRRLRSIILRVFLRQEELPERRARRGRDGLPFLPHAMTERRAEP